MFSPEVQNRINELRLKCDNGTITLEEMREGIKLMRQSRLTAGDAAKASRKSAPARSADDMLSQLM